MPVVPAVGASSAQIAAREPLRVVVGGAGPEGGRRSIKVTRYPGQHQMSVGVVRGDGDRASASARITVDQARETIAALEAACAAIAADAEAARESAG
jgi:hypothetical protein